MAKPTQTTQKPVVQTPRPEEVEESTTPTPKSKYDIKTEGNKRYVVIPVEGRENKLKQLYTEVELAKEMNKPTHKFHNYNFYVEDKNGIISSRCFRCKDDRTLGLTESETVSDYEVQQTTEVSKESKFSVKVALKDGKPFTGFKVGERPPVYIPSGDFQKMIRLFAQRQGE
jgi:hypothetical protein